MDNIKLKEIIRRKNERLEERALQSAEELINNIVELQEAIAEATKEIAEKREALQKLQITSLDADQLLGKV